MGLLDARYASIKTKFNLANDNSTTLGCSAFDISADETFFDNINIDLDTSANTLTNTYLQKIGLTSGGTTTIAIKDITTISKNMCSIMKGIKDGDIYDDLEIILDL